jgi:hypothetical protein
MMWSATDWALMGVAMLVFLTAVVGAIAWLVHGMPTAPVRRPERHGPTGRHVAPGGTGSNRSGSSN